MPNLLLGNPLQSFNEGEQTGRQNRFNALAGQAIAAQPDQRPDLIAQAAQADPTKALALNGALTQQADTDEDRRNKTLVNMSKLLVAAPDAYKDQVYQQIKPSLGKLGLTQPPPNYNDEIGKTAQAIVDAYTPVNAAPSGFRELDLQAKAAGYPPGSEGYQKIMRVGAGVEGRASNAGYGFEMVEGPDGSKRVQRRNPRNGAVEQYNEQTGNFEPVGTAASPSGPVSGGGSSTPPQLAGPVQVDTASEANALLKQGVPPDQAAARVTAKYREQLGATVPSIVLQTDGTFRNGTQGDKIPLSSAPVQPASPPNLSVSRPQEITAGRVQDAKNASDLAVLPATEAIKTNAAVDQAGRTAAVTNAAKSAAEQAQQTQQKTQDAHQVLSLLDEADKILPQATGSGAGRAIDSAAATFGKSTTGAQATAQLQAIAGRLTSSVPRMQGPQSDSDVRLYQQMAGDLANSELPVATRQAASRTIRQLQQKYLDNPAGNGTVVAAPYASQATVPAAAGGNFSHLWSK